MSPRPPPWHLSTDPDWSAIVSGLIDQFPDVLPATIVETATEAHFAVGLFAVEREEELRRGGQMATNLTKQHSADREMSSPTVP
jgi:hypothetical protein